MPTPRELEEKLWKTLKSDMTVMLGLEGLEDGHTRPMTAQIEEERGPIWFFASKDNALIQDLPAGARAIVTFASKGHDLFASIQGALTLEPGRDDHRPALESACRRLVRGWQERPKARAIASGCRARGDLGERIERGGRIKTLFGADPKQDYRDKVAKVRLR